MPDELVEPVRCALAWFGRERCLFDSDWPVCSSARTPAACSTLLHALAGRDAEVMGETAVCSSTGSTAARRRLPRVRPG